MAIMGERTSVALACGRSTRGRGPPPASRSTSLAALSGATVFGMTDPTPFLSTAIQTSAGMVAIVGGLQVARFISLESEQLGAEQRARNEKRTLRRYEAEDFLDHHEVLRAIAEGNTEVRELRRKGSGCVLADEELLPFVEEYRSEYERAFQVIDSVVHDAVELSPQEWQGLERKWISFRRNTPEVPADLAKPRLWELAFKQVIARRKRAAKERFKPARSLIFSVS